jgi:hypothetical protein
VSIKDAHTVAPVDWNDPEQAALQAKLDVLRNMINSNPMTYSEKDELVKKHLADEARRAEARLDAKAKGLGRKWKI